MMRNTLSNTAAQGEGVDLEDFGNGHQTDIFISHDSWRTMYSYVNRSILFRGICAAKRSSGNGK